VPVFSLANCNRDRRRCAGIATILLALACVAQGAQAETCYKDDSGRIVRRPRPGYVEVPCPTSGPYQLPPQNPGGNKPNNGEALPRDFVDRPDTGPPPAASPVPVPELKDYVEAVPVPDRWRIVDSLGYKDSFFDPYHRNVLKADKPVHGDWFFNLNLFSDSVYENRDVPAGVGAASTARAGENDTFGRSRENFFSQMVGAEFVYYKGDTVFKPPEYEFRFSPVFDFNYLSGPELQEVNINPQAGTSRTDHHVGIQALFADKHLRNVSDRFDFDSIRVGIQPFSSDFRGFLFQDNQLGVRLFGTRDNNIVQYNVAYFRRLSKDTNSGLNDLGQPLRHDDIAVVNLYKQDFLVKGFTSQWTVVYNHNREGSSLYYDTNGFIERPAALGIERGRDYDVAYLGYNADGHLGRWNLTSSFYYALGHESSGVFEPRPDEIRAWFGAVELSRDFDWIRPRLSLLYGSGDKNPFDRKATGFDAIVENPQFAGADSSYWIRQAVPLIGGGGVAISGRDGVLNDLRSGNNGQSNFTNPGIFLAGLGVDMDVLPTLRVSFNANHLAFVDPQVVEVARAQGSLAHSIGEDVSVAMTYRPLLSQNIVLRTSYARLISARGYQSLFPHSDPGYFLLNILFAY
jgi:hypothetical protein